MMHDLPGDRNGALYDIDSECEEGGDDDEKSSKSPKVIYFYLMNYQFLN